MGFKCVWKNEWGRACGDTSCLCEAPDYRWLCAKHRGMQDATGRLKAKAIEELNKILIRHAKGNGGVDCPCHDCTIILNAMRYLAKDQDAQTS